MRYFQNLLIIGVVVSISVIRGKAQQIQNGSFENWEKSNSNYAEPLGWNGVMSGDLCLICSMSASKRFFEDKNEFVSGKSSIRIESKTILGGIVFNGSVTTGQVVVSSPSATAGFSQTKTDNDNFNQRLEQRPDSLIFWAKYNLTDASDSAVVSVLIHGDENLKDPDRDMQPKTLVGVCQNSFQTNGRWQRLSFPIEYMDSYASPKFVLATFSSSHIAGKGNGDAKLWVDDIEFVYNNPELTSNN